jgi:hypothetical protein
LVKFDNSESSNSRPKSTQGTEKIPSKTEIAFENERKRKFENKKLKKLRRKLALKENQEKAHLREISELKKKLEA